MADLQDFYKTLDALLDTQYLSLIVTSRHTLMLSHSADVLHLLPLDALSSITLMKNASGTMIKWQEAQGPTKKGQAEVLAEICGYNAFALDMIGKFLKAKRCFVSVSFSLSLPTSDEK